MQSRHRRVGSQRDWHARPELDRFLAEVDGLLPSADQRGDRLAATWPVPAGRRPLFPFGVFASRAFLHR